MKFRQDLKLEFGQYFAADALYVEVMKLNLGRDSEASFGQNLEGLGSECEARET